jgi:DNA repair exonuclease SbcCD ATPase subunit
MNKLRELRIEGFRGARFTLPIDFTSSAKSISVYGDNAAGKSTITDALEWYLHNRVDHLWREDCKEEALRNVLLGADEACAVSVRFSDPSLDGSKQLSAKLNVSVGAQTKNAEAFLQNIQDERVFLRHAQITKFIGETKSKKRHEIASIIGYEEIVSFRDVIQSAVTALRKDSDYAAAKHLAEAAKNRIFQLSSSIVSNEAELFQKATGLVAKFEVVVPIKDDKSYDATIEKLRAKITKPDTAEKKIKLDQLKKDCEDLITAVPNLITARDEFFEPYNKLAGDKMAVSQLNVEQFLSQGAEVLEKGHFSEEKCPFCLTPYNLQNLKSQVEARISKIEALKKSYEGLKGPKDNFIETVSSVGILCKRLSEGYVGLDDATDVAKSTASILPLLRNWIMDTRTGFAKFELVAIDKEETGSLKNITSVAAQAIGAATKAIISLQLSKKEQELINTIEQVRELRTQYKDFEKHTKIIRAYETQILALSSLFDFFVPVQNAALQSVLDQISKDVGIYYALLHPKENVDQVRLRVVGDEGIEFEYHFHGKPTYPPMKYLSESHLNSLGICLFLASAKLFNRSSRFLVLDDIVTSFDVGHRRRYSDC